MNEHRKHRVVVVGGGFAGLQVVRGLRRAAVDVTLVDRQNFTLFQPLVYQVATGALSPAEIAMPQRALLRRQTNASVLLAEVVGFDLDAQQILIERRAGTPKRSTIGYDTRVVAGGAHYSYFGHEEWQLHAPELKSLDGALDIRSRILSAFEAAELADDERLRQEWLTVVVVVGGGPTGVEMAGQIAELGHDTLRRDFRRADTNRTRVLEIGGELQEKERTGVMRRRTRRTGRFDCRVTLPEQVEADKIEASLADGVLTVRVPKSERAQRKKIQVKGS